jgi:septum formation protein
VSEPGARVVLASASPRRRELLERAGLVFEVEPAAVDETLPPGLDPQEAARHLAERKARAVAERHPEPVLVLGADTIVARARGAEHEYFGKPGTPEEATAMLSALSGSRHVVVTGVCVLRTEDQRLWQDSERTWVTMRLILPHEIEAYVQSGEWRDKAGGYAIQESADRFVTALEEGGLDNVVGLPVKLALDLLGRIGAPCGKR